MKLTNREKILLIILLILAMIAGLYYFVITPAIDNIITLETQLKESNNKVMILNNELKLHTKLQEKYSVLHNDIMLTNEKYYTNIMQEKIIILLKEIIDKSNLEIENITFSDPEVSNIDENNNEEDNKKSAIDIIIDNFTKNTSKEEEKEKDEEINTDKMKITIDYNGNYDELLKFIYEVENNDKRIIVSDIFISKSDVNLSGSLTLEIYAIPTLFKELEEEFKYEFNSEFGRHNPFY